MRVSSDMLRLSSRGAMGSVISRNLLSIDEDEEAEELLRWLRSVLLLLLVAEEERRLVVELVRKGIVASRSSVVVVVVRVLCCSDCTFGRIMAVADYVVHRVATPDAMTARSYHRMRDAFRSSKGGGRRERAHHHS